MKFLSSLCSGIILSIVMILLMGMAVKCDHNNIIKVYSFESEKSTAMNSVKTVCDECGENFSLTLFRDTPPDEMYIDVVEEYCDDKRFVKGEYDTIKARVIVLDYFTPKTEIRCGLSHGGVEVYFSVAFKEEYEEAVSLLQVGDEITFSGKSASMGLSWTDCEIITD